MAVAELFFQLGMDIAAGEVVADVADGDAVGVFGDVGGDTGGQRGRNVAAGVDAGFGEQPFDEFFDVGFGELMSMAICESPLVAGGKSPPPGGGGGGQVRGGHLLSCGVSCGRSR
ncbi:hypothetical protein, partial [Nocardia aurantia]|uniref:hypothetical protein n=1 Tax=Nocardia aurantia TaxID=2585199 RepID=UPI003873CA73